ncbi:MAG: hypothetical protein DI587_35535 [Variovorax paradoxus]|nr:MAG: hypothetical protein DI583_35535 [Variovorax paradoxus]PZQ01163.1 MAG: hypothetical protein DI587_35535 [Variovorax paradoxus]
MNRLNAIVIATVVTVGFASQAQAHSVTREQVRAEYFAARDQGLLPSFGEIGYAQPLPSTPSAVTRAQVLKELAASGPLVSGEGADTGAIVRAGSERTRAEVRAEAVEAVRDGSIPGGEV